MTPEAHPEQSAGRPASSRFVLATLGAGALSLVLARLLAPSTATITDLWSAAIQARPYFVPSQAFRLYLLAPLFATAAVAMLLAPGTLIALGLPSRAARGWGSVIVEGFLWSYALRFGAHSLAKAAGATLSPTLFWTVEAVLLVAAAVFLTRCLASGEPPAVPEGPLRHLLWVLLIPAVVTLVMLPAIFWQDFTEDGMEALEIGRSLRWHVLPRFPDDGGYLGLGLGMVSMGAPVSWYIQMLGASEAAARLPLTLYLPVVAMAFVALAQHGRREWLRWTDDAMILLVLAAYVAAMGYSASYDAYGADLAAPTAFETLTLLCLSGIVVALWQGRMGLMMGFVALGIFARPTALMLVLLLGVATLGFYRGQERARMLRQLAIAFGACVLIIILYEKVYLGMLVGAPPSTGSGSVLERYRFLRFTDLRRLLWVVIPTGILGFLSLFAFNKQDRFARQLSIALLLYFLAFFVPAFVALHHFVPVMALPIVVLIRMLHGAPSRLRGVALVGCVAGLGLSVPHSLPVDRSTRAIGSRMAFEVGAYGDSPAGDSMALVGRYAVFDLFPPTWDVEPANVHVGASMPFLYYSHRAGVEPSQADYLLLPEGVAGPAPFTSVGGRRGSVAWVRDSTVWEADLASPGITTFGNPIFRIGQETLFDFKGVPAGAYDFSMRSVPVLWRFF